VGSRECGIEPLGCVASELVGMMSGHIMRYFCHSGFNVYTHHGFFLSLKNLSTQVL
jgi:hypothetical protein